MTSVRSKHRSHANPYTPSISSRISKKRLNPDQIPTDRHGKKIGIYTRAERIKKIEKLRKKHPIVKPQSGVIYSSRKKFAEARQRVNGRFVKGSPSPYAKLRAKIASTPKNPVNIITERTSTNERDEKIHPAMMPSIAEAVIHPAHPELKSDNPFNPMLIDDSARSVASSPLRSMNLFPALSTPFDLRQVDKFTYCSLSTDSDPLTEQLNQKMDERDISPRF